MSIPEGSTATFTVSLALEPSGSIEVTVLQYAGDVDITVDSPTPLFFDPTDFDVPKIVTLAAAEDADFLNGRATIRVDALEIPTAEVTAVELDSGLVPPVLFVDSESSGGDGSTWANALVELQGALDTAENSSGVSEIWVAAGTYRPASPGSDAPEAFQLLSGVGIYGGFAGDETSLNQRDPTLNVTFLRGNGGRVLNGSAVDATAILDGFTIEYGSAEDVIPVGRGGGIIISNASPTITDCRFQGNSASAEGGAMYIEDGNPTITNCRFSDNTAGYTGYGGAVVLSNASPLLVGCDFVDNGAGTGGALVNLSGAPTLMDCTFSSNSAGRGGGMYSGAGDPTLINCVFSGNVAEGWYDGSFGGGIIILVLLRISYWPVAPVMPV